MSDTSRAVIMYNFLLGETIKHERMTIMNFLKLKSFAIGLALLVVVPQLQTAAALTNGGFESGDFTSWSTIGDTSIQDATFGSGPTEGTYDALITNIDPNAPLLPKQPFSGEEAVDVVDLEIFLGLNPGDLSGLVDDGTPTKGSAIKQTFTANAGDEITFDWNFLTDETVAADETFGAFNDFAFVVIDGTVSMLADVDSSTFGPSGTPFDGETGFNGFTSSALTGGSHTLGIGVVHLDEDDTFDVEYASGLLLDDISIPAFNDTSTVPEPGSVALFGTGLLGLIGYGWRRRKQLA